MRKMVLALLASAPGMTLTAQECPTVVTCPTVVACPTVVTCPPVVALPACDGGATYVQNPDGTLTLVHGGGASGYATYSTGGGFGSGSGLFGLGRFRLGGSGGGFSGGGFSGGGFSGGGFSGGGGTTARRSSGGGSNPFGLPRTLSEYRAYAERSNAEMNNRIAGLSAGRSSLPAPSAPNIPFPTGFAPLNIARPNSSPYDTVPFNATYRPNTGTFPAAREQLRIVEGTNPRITPTAVVPK
ncbi:MAG: hypothetical protein MUF18_13695 [Fimbriiglobus sp.]|nr:hypothetical protein [Fimbriiglobus sp.]